eukprot:590776-Prymnesium_polylepis.1
MGGVRTRSTARPAATAPSAAHPPARRQERLVADPHDERVKQQQVCRATLGCRQRVLGLIDRVDAGTCGFPICPGFPGLFVRPSVGHNFWLFGFHGILGYAHRRPVHRRQLLGGHPPDGRK